jgi:hypothetical protein
MPWLQSEVKAVAFNSHWLQTGAFEFAVAQSGLQATAFSVPWPQTQLKAVLCPKTG